jgi:hypothetical protein
MTNPEMLPSPADIPQRAVSLDPAAAAQRRALRRKLQQRTRLTHEVQKKICDAMRIGVPATIAWRAAGVSEFAVRSWFEKARLAENKPWSEWSQLDRRCVEFILESNQATAEAVVRLQGTIASAGGLTTKRPTSTIERTFTAADGTTTSMIERRGHAPDWRAAEHAAKVLFPTEMGGITSEDVDEAVAQGVTLGQAMERIKQFRAQRAEREAVPADEEIIEAQVIEDEPPTVNT